MAHGKPSADIRSRLAVVTASRMVSSSKSLSLVRASTISSFFENGSGAMVGALSAIEIAEVVMAVSMVLPFIVQPLVNKAVPSIAMETIPDLTLYFTTAHVYARNMT